MEDVVQRVEHKSENDHQIRLLLNDHAFLKREQVSVLGLLEQYWRECRTNLTAHGAMKFNPGAALSSDALSWVSWIDTRPTEASNFIWHNHVYSWLGDISTDYYDASETRVRDHRVKSHSRFCAEEYQLCKSMKQPLYHEIEQHTGSVSRHYTRLLLPVMNAKEEVDRIFYVCRRFLPM